MRKTLRKMIPIHAVLPLLLTAGSMLCSYQAAKLWQMIFGFHDPADLSLAFDLQTPFRPGWAWVYLLSYFFWMYVYITTARDSESSACKLAVSDITGKLICLLFFLLFPTTNIRPEVSGTGFTAFLMRTIYRMDSPTNLFPSIHCFIAWLGTRCIFSVNNLRHKGFHCAFSVAGTLLVFASTLFTKQHVVLDVLGGMAVAEIGLLIARFSPLPRLLKKWNGAFMQTPLCKHL